mgnify:CR=1 FL=1
MSNHGTFLVVVSTIFVQGYSMELSFEIDVFDKGLAFLNIHDLLNHISDIERIKIDPKLSSFDLREIKKVLNEILHDHSTRLRCPQPFL